MQAAITEARRIDRLAYLLEHEVKTKLLRDVRKRLEVRLLDIFQEEEREVLARLSKINLPRVETRLLLEQGWEEAQAEQLLLLIFDYDGNALRVAKELVPFTEEASRLGGIEGARLVSQMIGFNVRHILAEEWIRTHAIQFGREYAYIIAETTNKRIRDALAKGLTEGDDLLGLRDRVKAVYKQFPNYRAQMIARTETGRAYSMGNMQLYGEIGITRVNLVGCDSNCGQCGPVMAGGPYTLDEARAIEMSLHPNHDGDWVPDTESMPLEDILGLAA